MEHKERYIANPVRLLRSLAHLALLPIKTGDNALYEFDDHRPYNESNYPPILHTEAPAASEDEL